MNNNNNNNNNKENKNIYIRTLEATDIYNHLNRERELKEKYIGMLPFSLELIKLKKENIKIKQDKITNKKTSDDIINVKFNQKVRSSKDLIKLIKKKIVKLEEKLYDIEKTQKYIDSLKNSIKELEKKDYKEVTQDELREMLYCKGFELQNGKRKVKYVVYKRSSAKSRTGQVLFIKENLYKKMKKWSNMGLKFKGEIDYPSLLSYESLVTSAIEDIMYIDVDKILIIDDVFSRFNQVCNVVKKDKYGELDSFEEEVEVENNIYDGQSLLEAKYFEDGKSMKLLRNHFFKSAAFSTNIQQFLKDNCPENVKYDDWYITNMFGEKIKASNVEMITTPSSLKALKFSKLVGTEKDMFNYWKDIVKKDNCVFGICKSEKETKRGQVNNMPLQQLSYQMLNSMPFNANSIKDITELEKDFIEKLKNNDEVYINYLKEKANLINSNDMWVDLYNINKDITYLDMFKRLRADNVYNYINYVKKGKVRVIGDYCVMIGNGLEMLYSAIGINVLDENYKKNMELKGNNIYTPLFKNNEELVCFRNPHTSQANVLRAKNVYSNKIEKYFNLSKNTVMVNSIDFAIQDILSSADYDSDCILISNNKTLVELGDKCFNNYKVAINAVEADKKLYNVNNYNMYLIDKQLAKSQRYIGEVVNVGQLCLSKYWDLKNKNKDNKELLKCVDIMTVLSCITIDLAKKLYDIDIEATIKKVKERAELNNKKPLFFRYVCENNPKTSFYNTSMDLLQLELDKIKTAEHKKTIDFVDFLKKYELNKADRKQRKEVLEKIKEYSNKANKIEAEYINSYKSKDKKEKQILLEDNNRYFRYFIEKRKINEVTMFSILKQLENNNNKVDILNMLYLTQKDVFLNAFNNVIESKENIIA